MTPTQSAPVSPSPTVLFATAEFSPLARVGGLAEAAAGLVRELHRQGVAVTVVLPDYGDVDLATLGGVGIESWELELPSWAGSTQCRRTAWEGVGDVILVSQPGLARPHPYVNPQTGQGWPDNDHRFFAFSAAVAALSRQLQPDVLHLNDWHTALAPAFLDTLPPTVLTIHTLGYQGIASGQWLNLLPHHRWRYAWYGDINPLVGAVRSVDRVIAVSPNYAREILTPEQGMGLDQELALLGDRLIGIRNGIDAQIWNPRTDQTIPQTYHPDELSAQELETARAFARRAIATTFGIVDDDDVVIAIVGRLVDQKGVDLALGLGPFLEHLGAKLVILGSGQANWVAAVHEAIDRFPYRIAAITDRYDEPLAHQMFAGADLFLMPSRFEPCGLAQMQAMAYGAIPVATAVGGLLDTIIDLDDDPAQGTGILSREVSVAGMVDAVHRAVRVLQHRQGRRGAQRRGMRTDWSWADPAHAHRRVYDEIRTSHR